MTAIELYMPPLFFGPQPSQPWQPWQPWQQWQLPYEYLFLCGALLATLGIVLRNRCVLNEAVGSMADSVCDLYVEQNKLGKVMDSQVEALQKSFAALEERVFDTEVLLDKLRFLTDEQVKESNFACEIASSAYVVGAHHAVAYMDQPLTTYLNGKAPLTARQILDYFTENKAVLDPKFFSHPLIPSPILQSSHSFSHPPNLSRNPSPILQTLQRIGGGGALTCWGGVRRLVHTSQ